MLKCIFYMKRYHVARLSIKHGAAPIAKQTKAKAEKNFLNNEEFYKELCEFLTFRQGEIDAGREIPIIPNSIGTSLLKIATYLSNRHYFINYTYKDEMISDAVQNCIQYLHKFNPAQSTNPFSYFLQTSYYAFVRRIQAEQKQTAIKASIVQNLGVTISSMVLEQHDEDSLEFTSHVADLLQASSTVDVASFFNSKKKPKKEKVSLLAAFMDIPEVIEDNISLEESLDALSEEELLDTEED